MNPLPAVFLDDGLLEAGCDEAGRGCLAGPVFAAAVILPGTFSHPLLNDSKQLSEPQRELLRVIIEDVALAWSVAQVSSQEIDQINILSASFLAMHRAVGQLRIKPGRLLIDGNRFAPYPEIPHHCIVKGDSKMASIAAASILAKTHRDEHMKGLASDYPVYGWEINKGYPTKMHREAILKFGMTEHHRVTFRVRPPEPGTLWI